MPPRKTTSFWLQAVVLGVAAVLLVWLLRACLLDRQRPAVQLQQAPASPMVRTAGVSSYADAVAQAAPAVVNIYTTKHVAQPVHPLLQDPVFRRFFGEGGGRPRERLESSLGSGVVVSKDGYVLTNHHVVAGAEQILVALQDGRNAAAQVVGSDPDTDLAVLRVALDRLPVVTIGRSAPLRVGDVVLAIGNPFGVGQTVTQGIVSAIGRSALGINVFEDFIQTDAAINPGNSGGALINPNGDLVGINTAIFSKSGGSQGIGFAIPTDLAKGILEQIVERGRVTRGWLGVEIQDLTPALAESLELPAQQGAIIAGVLRNGPADRAGLQPGDTITGIDEHAVTDTRTTLDRIARIRPGTQVSVTLLRSGRAVRVEVEVGERPAGSDQ